MIDSTVSTPPAQADDIAFHSTDGTPLKAWYWSRPHPKGVLIISHGLGEHGGAYRHVAEYLSQANDVDVLAFDYRGHGRSPGPRGSVATYGEFVDDLLGALKWVASRPLEGLPRFLLGHSNGGLVALRAVIEDRPSLAGLIVSNPALRLASKVPWPKRAAGAILRGLAPGLTLPTDIHTEEMTADPQMILEREADPLRHSRICAAIYYGMIQGGQRTIEQAGMIQTPTLLILSGADRVIDPAGSRAFFDRLGSADKTLRLYPEALHEPLNDVARAQVVADLSGWLADHLRAQSN